MSGECDTCSEHTIDCNCHLPEELKGLIPEFDLWAFGPGPFENALDRMNAWNERHGDKLMLDPNGNIFEDLCKMGGIWHLEKSNAN